MSTKPGRQHSKGLRNNPRKTGKRQERSELPTSGSTTKRRKKDSHKEDASYKGSSDSDESDISKEAKAFLKEFKNTNDQLAEIDGGNFRFRPAIFNIFLDHLMAGKYEALTGIRKDIDTIIKWKLEQIGNISKQEDALNVITLLEDFKEKWNGFMERIYRPMAPSVFAKSAGWVIAQKGPAAIDCMRPPDCSGLPISLLHPAFAKFISITHQPLPTNGGCLEVALLADEFPNFIETKFGSASLRGAILGKNGAAKALLEIKNEPGAMGDVYMQGSAYRLNASLSAENIRRPLPETTVRCPRVYNSFQTFEGQSRSFKFISPYKPKNARHDLLFKATVEDSAECVLVKVVPGPYGERAHRIAAEQGLAPQLYGVAKLGGAPPAFVMEFLSEKEGWVAFQEAKLYLKNEQQWVALHAEAERFLQCMRDNQLGVELRVLDWDWSGRYSDARYPLDINPQAGLPGEAGELILPQHDSSNFSQCLETAKQWPFR
ncbi:14611_t:CDS:2 [Acaulospora colombiana]|uniref:14611_t:CDS:1 n=1 Tax=Acaulospora colombiana TaxID=27376 RepID=A0ACA9N0T8_9GLOM|nr:14611_t:CDS:2 [Acaulospora colombiana]